MHELPFKSGSFDQVLLLEVLEHIKPSETFSVLQEVYRVLKTGGKFIISVPINEHLEDMLPINPNSHMRMYSEALIKYELIMCKFKVNKILSTSAFKNMFMLKSLINKYLYIKEKNNIILICQK